MTNEYTSDAHRRIVMARSRMLLSHPFYAHLALRLELVEVPRNHPRIKTLAVNGKQMFFNPAYVDKLDDPHVMSAVGHEVLHCANNHIQRLGSRNPRKWNYAGDYVNNLMLKDEGFSIHKNWLLHEGFRGMDTDEIYNLLPDSDDTEGGGSGHAQPGGQGTQPQDEMLPGSDPDNPDKQPSKADQDELAAEWRMAAMQAAQAAKMQGRDSATVNRFVEEILAPKENWRNRLWRFASETSKDDYSWMRPNRRMMSYGLILPGMYDESMGEMVVVIDTSGSITQKVLDAFGAEITDIHRNVRPQKLHVVYCDAAINKVVEFGPDDHLKFEMVGGGGTDFNPPFKWVEKNVVRPEVFLYLTDMYGSFPAKAPDYPVLWCKTTKAKAPWGEEVFIDLNDQP